MLNTPRYGLKIRKNYKKIYRMKKALYVCPRCERKKLKREGFALFVCKACGAVVAGGAYSPTTEAGQTFMKTFLTFVKG